MTILNRLLKGNTPARHLNWRMPYTNAPLVVAMWAVACGKPLRAQDFTPTKFTDLTGQSDGSLRDIITQVNADAAVQADRILLNAGTYVLSIPGRAMNNNQ